MEGYPPQSRAAPATVTGERRLHHATGLRKRAVWEGGYGASIREPGDLPMMRRSAAGRGVSEAMRRVFRCWRALLPL